MTAIAANATTRERPRRRGVVAITIVVLLTVSAGERGLHAEEKGGSSLTGGGSTSGPPAPAVPAIAATPEPAAKPAVPNAPVEPGVAARAEPAEPPPSDAKPRSVKLWPLFEYESDPATRQSRVRIFGPLLEYRGDAERQSFFFRPLISISQTRVGHDDDVDILHLLTSHWGQTDQVTKGFGGLFTYRTRTSADGRTLESQRMRLLPLYFYEWDKPQKYGRVSVPPFYADVEDLLGYDRVEMALFPAYLHVQRPALDRYYYPFPIISRDGPPGSGYRLWPFPLRDREGNRIEPGTGRAESERQTYFPVWRDELGEPGAPTADPSPVDPS